MKVTSITAFSGLNRYCPRPVLQVRFDFPELQDNSTLPDSASLEKILSELIPGFNELPSQENTTGIAAINLLPSVALAIQNLTGCHLRYEQISQNKDSATLSGSYETVFAFESSTIARLAFFLSFRIIIAVLHRRFSVNFPPNLRVPEDFIIKQQLKLFTKSTSQHSLDDSTRDIVRALEQRQIPWHRMGDSTFMIQAGYGEQRKLIYETITSGTAVPGSMISQDKNLTNHFLQNARFPVPRQAIATSLEQASRHAQSIGYPLVVKPAVGGKGRGITIGVKDEVELKTAFTLANSSCPRVVIETFLAGEDHRFLVVGNSVAAVAKRIPGQVIGDGRSTVGGLLDTLNARPDRGEGYGRHFVVIDLDQHALEYLHKQGLSPDSVPAQNQIVALRRTANMSMGGTSLDVTDSVHPDNIAMAERAAAITGLDIVGVDFISTDISRSYLEIGGGICEINVGPGLRPHWFAQGGEKRDVAGSIVEHLFPEKNSTNGVPLSVAVTGTNGKTTTCRMVDAILRQSGLFSGMTNSDGIYINGRLIMKGDQAGFGGARTILADSRIEAAVLETSRGGILKSGIGFSACTVSAVLNITPDHLGFDGVNSLEEMADIKRLVAELAQDTVVLNADDPLCVDMIRHLAGRKLSLVTRDPDNSVVMIPVANVDSIVTLGQSKSGEFNKIIIRANDEETLILNTRDIPATFDGLARHNVDNAMSAIAITYSMGINIESIRTALRKFTNDFDNAPGRANIIHDETFTVMLDYGHNPEGIRAIGDLIEEMEVEGRVVCILSSPSNRLDEHFSEMAGVAAKYFDHIICSNWYELRDRPPEFVPDALSKALKTCGFDEDKITICYDPGDSIKTALQDLEEDDFLVIFGDQPSIRRKLILAALPSTSG